MIIRSLFILQLVGLCFLSSCVDNSLYTQSYELKDATWASNQNFEFEFQIDDNSKSNQMFLTMRLNEDYPYSNIHLLVSTEGPKKELKTDTLSLLLAEVNGKWKGEKSGSLVEFVSPFFNNKFPFKGKYKLIFQQVMRDENLPGIVDFGIKID